MTEMNLSTKQKQAHTPKGQTCGCQGRGLELIRTSKHYKFYSQKNIKKRSFHKLAVNLELFTAKSHHAISIFTTALRTWAGAPTAHSGLCTSPG